MPIAISYTTADEGAQYSSYYARAGPGSAPAGGPMPELGVPTAISYTDVGLGSYSGNIRSYAVQVSTWDTSVAYQCMHKVACAS